MDELLKIVRAERELARANYFTTKGNNRAFHYGQYKTAGLILEKINELKQQQNG